MSNMDKKEFLMTNYEKMRIEAAARMTAMGIDTVTIENYKRNGRIPVYSKNGENSLTSYIPNVLCCFAGDEIIPLFIRLDEFFNG